MNMVAAECPKPRAAIPNFHPQPRTPHCPLPQRGLVHRNVGVFWQVHPLSKTSIHIDKLRLQSLASAALVRGAEKEGKRVLQSSCQRPTWHSGENMAQLRDDPLSLAPASPKYGHVQGARPSSSHPPDAHKGSN